MSKSKTLEKLEERVVDLTQVLGLYWDEYRYNLSSCGEIPRLRGIITALLDYLDVEIEDSSYLKGYKIVKRDKKS